MPGAIYSPLSNPEASYQQYSGDYAPGSYKAQADRGYSWNGTRWDYTGGGTSATDAMKKADPSLGGLPSTSGSSGLGGASSSSMFGSSFGGKNPFATDAAAAKLRDEFSRMRKRTAGSVNENSAAGGTFSSGVREAVMGDAMTQLDLQEGAGLESLFNNSAQQQLAFQLEQERMKNQAMYGGGSGSQRFDGASTGGNPNQQVSDYYSSKKSNSGASAQGGGGVAGGSTGGGGVAAEYAGDTSQGVEPSQAPGESSYAFYARLNAYHDRMRKGY